jgi:hypothetical protein
MVMTVPVLVMENTHSCITQLELSFMIEFYCNQGLQHPALHLKCVCLLKENL